MPFFQSAFIAVTMVFSVSCLAHATWPIKDVLKQANRREKVLIEGRIQRAFDFDTFLVSDSSGEIAVSFVGLKQNVGASDNVVIYGWFDGRATYVAKYGLLYALEWAPAADADALRKKYTASRPTEPLNTPERASSPASLNIESRLKVLEDLKNKGLISTDEYQDQRKRILNDL